jgi:hypothetical protein
MPTTKSKAARKIGDETAVGQQVHYVWPDSGHHHAAFIANVLDADRGYVTLFVIDHNGGPMASPWTEYGADGAPGTWHFIEDTTDADPLDPAGLNIEPDGTLRQVPTGTTAEVVVSEATPQERAADATPPRLAAKDDPGGHRTLDVAARAGTPDAVDRGFVTETAGEKAAARLEDTGRPVGEPAARNFAAEPSTKRAAEREAERDADKKASKKD